MSESPITIAWRYGHAFVATWPRRTALAAALSAAGTAAVLGGWASVPPDPVPDISPGETVDLGRLSVEVIGWEVRGNVAQDSLEDYPGADAWLFLEVIMASATDQTERATHDVVDLPDDVLLDPDKPEPHRLMMLRDATHDPELQPGIPERVIFVWPVAADSIGDAATMKLQLIGSKQFKASTGEQIWTETGVEATIDAPRDDQVGREFLPQAQQDAEENAS